MKYKVFLLLFFALSSFSIAADRPTWTMDVKKMNFPQKIYSPKEPVLDPNYKVQFTPDDKVLISFLDRRPQTELVTKATPEKSGSFFVVVLFSRETGELNKRVEWPVIEESVPNQILRYGSRIYPLPSGGYVGIINRNLQVFDSSFNVIYERILERHKEERYDLITPLYGQFFIFKSWDGAYFSTEIINSKTFDTVDKFSIPNGVPMEIWGDRLLATWRTTGINEVRFVEKKVGDSQWNVLETVQGLRAEAKFIYNGTIIVMNYSGKVPNTEGFWFTIEDGKKGDVVFEAIGGFKPSWKTPIIATRPSYYSGIRRTLDLNSLNGIEVYDISTRQILFTTKKYNDIADYAISPNGDSIVLMTKRKIELYNVPNAKKSVNK